jgi:hypothetical protein
MSNPEPDPWRSEAGPVSAAVAGFVSAAVAKATAAGLGDKGKEIKAAANASIAQLMDDYCGTPPKKWPWPWPGPPPWNWLIVSELTAVAQTVQDGALRTELQGIATQVAQKTTAV